MFNFFLALNNKSINKLRETSQVSYSIIQVLTKVLRGRGLSTEVALTRQKSCYWIVRKTHTVYQEYNTVYKVMKFMTTKLKIVFNQQTIETPFKIVQ